MGHIKAASRMPGAVQSVCVERLGGYMRAIRLLWIDLRNQSSGGLAELLPGHCEVARVSVFDSAVDAAQRLRPHLSCIEFDYPDHPRLRVVTSLKRVFPALPLLMFTEHHSEALAVWAFRSGVWDYRVKPIEAGALRRILSAVTDSIHSGCGASILRPPLPNDLIDPAGHLQHPPAAAPKTGLAVAYIADHLGEDIKRERLARLCHLSPSEFSRAFRREQGATFERFLMDCRIAKARDLLAEPASVVSQVAYAAGFNDPAYFSRAFRRLVGLTASEYQRHAQSPVPPSPVRAPSRARLSMRSAD